MIIVGVQWQELGNAAAASSLSDFTLAEPARFTIRNNQAGFS